MISLVVIVVKRAVSARDDATMGIPSIGASQQRQIRSLEVELKRDACGAVGGKEGLVIYAEGTEVSAFFA